MLLFRLATTARLAGTPGLVALPAPPPTARRRNPP